MKLQALTSSSPAVTLAEAKAHLRIEPDFTGHDATLTTFALAATQWVENETRQQLVTRQYRLTLDAFPQCREIKLPRAPLQSVESVKYLYGGSDQSLDASAFTADPSGSKPGRITLNAGYAWPHADDAANAIRVTFNTGYGIAADVPQILKQCVLLMTGHFFENREAAIDRRIDTIPLAVESIILQHAFPEAA